MYSNLHLFFLVWLMKNQELTRKKWDVMKLYDRYERYDMILMPYPLKLVLTAVSGLAFLLVYVLPHVAFLLTLLFGVSSFSRGLLFYYLMKKRIDFIQPRGRLCIRIRWKKVFCTCWCCWRCKYAEMRILLRCWDADEWWRCLSWWLIFLLVYIYFWWGAGCFVMVLMLKFYLRKNWEIRKNYEIWRCT